MRRPQLPRRPRETDPLGGWATVRLVAGREIAERLRGRLIRVVTIITALLVVAGVTVPGLVHGHSKPTRIGLVGPAAQALASPIARTAHAARLPVHLTPVAEPAQARRQLERGQLDVTLSVAAGAAHVEVKQSLAASIRAVLQTTLDAAQLHAVLARAGVPASEVAAALRPVPLATTALHPVPADRPARDIAAFAAALLMYVSLAMYGTAVATGVAQEKTSRTAEVLLAAVSPRQLLAGKVLGIGATALGQLAVAAAAGLIANAVVHSARIPGSVLALLPAFLVCFLAGFLLYAFALAAAGALVARQEEVQMVTTPIMFVLVIGYLLVFVGIGSPDATWLKVLSLLPPLTATLMPARIALGHVAAWEFPLAALIMVISISAVASLASRIYAGALIHGGERLGWRAALRLQGRSRRASDLSSV